MSRSIRPALVKVMRALAVLPLLLLLSAICASAATFEETYQQAQSAYKAGDFAKAGALFVQAGDELQKKKDPRAGLLWGNGAIALMKAKDYAAAADTYERILGTKNPPKEKLPQYYSNLVLCRAELNQRALEIEAIDRMLKAIPKLAPADLAEVYARQGDAYRALELYGPAAGAYDKAAHVLPKAARPEQRARIFNALGLCQGNMGDYANAEKSLTEARALAATLGEDLTMAESDSNLGILHWERGDYPEAMKLLTAALERETAGNMRAKQGVEKNNIGLVHLATGNHAKAMDHFEDSLALAKEATDTRSEAIATVNKALVNRIAGQLNEARSEYKAAGALFDKAGFQEGQATTMLGVGKMAELEDKNYTQALENYLNALKIYEKLDLPRWQAVALLQLGGLHRRLGTPERRTTRDLVFDEEPTVPDMPKDEALAKSRDYYSKSLALAEKLSTRELIWKAHQGLGYLDFQEGKLEPAFEHYQKAIDLVSRLFVSLEDVQLLGEFMADKEDLYNEAQELCAALYDKTKDKKYLDLQMRYADTLRNEIQKASTALLQLNFEDKNKQKLYEQLQKLGRANAKAAKAIPVVKELPADADANAKAEHKLTEKAAADQKARVQKLDAEYNKLLAEWKKQYPGDGAIFDSSTRVDVKSVQNNIKNDDAFIQYIQLPNKLLIIVATKNDVETYSVDISKKKLDEIIKKDFLVNYIEKYGHAKTVNAKFENECFDHAISVLSTLYGHLINPIRQKITDKKRLYITADGFLAQVPFAALVQNSDAQSPHFMIEDYEISNVRPSFIASLISPNTKPSTKTLLGIGNPKNSNIVSLPELEGAEKEVKFVDDNIVQNPSVKDVRFSKEASDTWFENHLNNNSYETIYFATHGVPYSEVYYSYYQFLKQMKKAYGEDAINKEKELIEKFLPTRSPLNGYLYMANDESNPQSSGLFTIKKVLELPESAFEKTKYIVLSACNTGVTFAPKTLKKEDTQNALAEAKAAEQELRKAGFVPGVDQVSFVDAFMRRGINNVYGTLWFASDAASYYLMTEFMRQLYSNDEKKDAVSAFASAQRSYIAESKAGKQVLGSDYDKPLHPFYWAVGGIFGK